MNQCMDEEQLSRHTRPPDRSKARQSKHQHGIGWHSIDSASCHLKLPGRASAASARWTAHLSHFFPFWTRSSSGISRQAFKGLPTGHRFMERSQSRSVDQTRRDRRRSVGRPQSTCFHSLSLSLTLWFPSLFRPLQLYSVS